MARLFGNMRRGGGRGRVGGGLFRGRRRRRASGGGYSGGGYSGGGGGRYIDNMESMGASDGAYYGGGSPQMGGGGYQTMGGGGCANGMCGRPSSMPITSGTMMASAPVTTTVTPSMPARPAVDGLTSTGKILEYANQVLGPAPSLSGGHGAAAPTSSAPSAPLTRHALATRAYEQATAAKREAHARYIANPTHENYRDYVLLHTAEQNAFQALLLATPKDDSTGLAPEEKRRVTAAVVGTAEAGREKAAAEAAAAHAAAARADMSVNPAKRQAVVTGILTSDRSVQDQEHEIAQLLNEYSPTGDTAARYAERAPYAQLMARNTVRGYHAGTNLGLLRTQQMSDPNASMFLSQYNDASRAVFAEAHDFMTPWLDGSFYKTGGQEVPDEGRRIADARRAFVGYGLPGATGAFAHGIVRAAKPGTTVDPEDVQHRAVELAKRHLEHAADEVLGRWVAYEGKQSTPRTRARYDADLRLQQSAPQSAAPTAAPKPLSGLTAPPAGSTEGARPAAGGGLRQFWR